MADKAIELTADIVSAFLERNSVAREALPDLIKSVHGALSGAGEPEAPAPAERLSPAKIRASIKPDVLISFEDGRPYRMLRRHLRSHGLTPDAYREKWGLPEDYPMVAPTYAKARSDLAKKMGLGTKGAQRKRAGRRVKS